MKLGIDIRDLRIAQTGAKTYLSELSNAFNNIFTIEIVLLDTQKNVYKGNNKLFKIIEHLRFFGWKQFQLPRLAIKNNCTHLICTDFFVPYFKRWNGHPLKTIAVLHDAFFWESPEHYNSVWLQLFHLIGVPAAKKADLLIVPTQYAKNRILHFENFDAFKIKVVHEAAKTLPLLAQPEIQLAQIAPSLVGQPYFLHVGVLEKRKNITTLLEAFSMVQKNNPAFKLVLVGNTPVKDKLNDEPAIMETIHRLKIKDAIIRLGYLDAENLSSIYQSAFAYIFPSLNEGFGLPVLEAFNAGLPLICANNSALPEVAEDAALYFDPHNISELASCMQQLISDTNLRMGLIQKGKLQLNKFSWTKAANEISAALLAI
jgi:glycosyltransferase involved in cell wall biosynthesis